MRTLTFVFTDIEGSSSLWERDPEAMRLALARHDALLVSAVGGAGGRVFKHTGDGAAAVFDEPVDAAGAVRTLQAALAAEPWPTERPLRARVGVHTGPAEERDGDFFGPTLNRCARLMGLAHGGQVVCSHTTALLLADRELPLVDLGEHRLRGLTRPERVFQIGDDAFPPLRSSPAEPGNLPVQLTSFVGRVDDIAALVELVASDRLVTLTGVGGVGKTRLALQAAAHLAPRFTGGTWLVELAALSDPSDVVPLVASTLGVLDRAGQPLERSIIDRLAATRALLVLDNCEHLIDPIAAVAHAITVSCPDVRVLATSREALAVPGERVLPVRPLDVTAEGDAARLFADRASAVRPGFVVDDGNRAAVAEVCRRLDGIPLAIELAAARTASLSPEEIARRLGERFRLLTGNRRGVVERHQTLRATVEWSYALCSEAEQALFDSLGVFPATFDLAAVAAVAGLDEWDVVDLLGALVAKSLVVTDDSPDGLRYRLLETLRQYARDHLRTTGQVEDLRRRHAAHYADWAEEAGHGLLTSEELVWRARCQVELDNLRSAIDWSLDSDDHHDLTIGLRVIAALGVESSNDPALGVGAWAERALPRLDEVDDALRARVLLPAMWGCLVRADFVTGLERAALLRGLDRFDGLVDPVFVIAGLATGTLATSGVDGALAVLDDDIDRATTPYGYSVVHSIRGIFHLLAGHVAEARADTEIGLREARRLGHPTALSIALHGHGWAIEDLDPLQATAELEESLALTRAGATASGYGSVLGRLIVLRGRAGDTQACLDLTRELLTYFARSGDRWNLASALEHTLPLYVHHVSADTVAHLAAIVDTCTPAVLTHTKGTVEEISAAVGRDRYDTILEAVRHLPDPDLTRTIAVALDELAANLAGNLEGNLDAKLDQAPSDR